MIKIDSLYRNGNHKVVKVFKSLCNPKQESLEIYLHKKKKDGAWGDTIAMCFVSMVHGVNVVSISNSSPLLDCSSAFDHLKTVGCQEYIQPNVRTAYVYHHCYKNPFASTPVANHFALLKLCTSPHTVNATIYRGWEHHSLKRSSIEKDSDDGNVCIKKRKKESNTSISYIKSQKQMQLGDWLSSMTVNASLVAKCKRNLEEADNIERVREELFENVGLKSNANKAVVRSSYSVIQDMLKVVESGTTSAPPVYEASAINFRKRHGVEYSWRQRAAMAFFYYSPYFSNKNLTLCASVFEVKPNTLLGWVTKTDMLPKWVPVAEELTVGDVINSLDEKWRKHYSTLKVKRSVGLPMHILTRLKGKLPGKKVLHHHLGMTSFQQKVAIAKAQPNICHYLKTHQQRLRMDSTSTGKFHEEYEWVKAELNLAWNRGMPLTMSDLMDFLRQKFKNGAVYESHLKKSCSKTAWQWLRRAVQKANFSP